MKIKRLVNWNIGQNKIFRVKRMENKEWWEKLTNGESKGVENSMWGNKNWEVLTMYERHKTTNVP